MENYYRRELEKLVQHKEQQAVAVGQAPTEEKRDHSHFNTKDILKGFARLSASIQEKLDDHSRFLHALAEQIAPDESLPIPSLTLLEFEAHFGLQQTRTLEKGTLVESGPIELPDGFSQVCYFTLLHSLKIAPIRLEQAKLSTPSDHLPYIEKHHLDISLTKIISLDLVALNVDLSEVRLSDLQFYFTGKHMDAANLFFLFHHYLQDIYLINAHGQEISLGKKKLRFPDFSNFISLNKSMLNTGFEIDILREYFLFPQALLHCTLDLSSWKGQAEPNFTLKFVFSSCPFQITDDKLKNIKIHCVPAVNLFIREAKPVEILNPFADIPLILNRKPNEIIDIYKIKSVKGLSAHGNKNRYYQSLRDKIINMENQNPTYNWQVRENLNSGHRSHYLNLAYSNLLDIIEDEVLNIEALCTNQNLPESINSGGIDRYSSNTSKLLSFKNITKPTPYKKAILQDPEMTILACSQLNYVFLTQINDLHYLLKYYARYADQAVLAERKIQGINSIEIIKEDKVFKGNLVKGSIIELSVRLSQFECEGDIFLLGTVLSSIYASRTTFNTFSQLVIKDIETQKYLQWPPEFNQESIS